MQESLEVEFIDRVIKNIEELKNWTTRSYARDKYEKPVNVCDKNASKWCMLGSWWKEHVEGNYNPNDKEKLCHLRMNLTRFVGKNLTEFNDDNTHGVVIHTLRTFKETLQEQS